MKISGVFKFYQNGELIGEAENSLTETGRILAIKTLMGAIPNFGTSLGVGVGEIANTMNGNLATDYRLGFRVATAPVIATNIDTIDDYDAILFKAKLTDNLFYRIKEVGLFSDPLLSGATGYKEELILAFENGDNLYNNTDGAYLTDDSYNDSTAFFTTIADNTYVDYFRIGRRALVLKDATQIITTKSFIGLDQYDDLDKITLAFGRVGSGTSVVKVRFYTNDAYKEYTFSGSSNYNVVSVDLGSVTTTSGSGTFNWENITKVMVYKSSGNEVVLDGLKIENVNLLDTNRGMVSRAVLPGTGITKLANVPVDIEYTLRIGFGG